jgi:hypothetical protein
MPTPAEILTQAKSLLADPASWHRKYTHFVSGGGIAARDIVTAILNAGEGFGLGTLSTPEFKAAYAAMWEACEGRGIINFNDDSRTTHPEMLSKFDQAIKIAQDTPMDLLISRTTNSAPRPYHRSNR